MRNVEVSVEAIQWGSLPPRWDQSVQKETFTLQLKWLG